MSYTKLITGRLSLALLLTPLALAACGDDGQGDDEAGTETTAGESGESGTDGAEAGTDDQGTTETDGAEQGGTDESDTGVNEDTGGTDTGGTDTGGEVDPEIIELCEAGCALVEECTEPLPGCLQECIESHTQYADDPECLAAEMALTECIGGLTCDEFLQEDPPPCEAEFDETCDGGPPPLCMVGFGQGNNPDECNVSVECEGDPVYEVDCAGGNQGCTCLVDGQEVGGCAQAAAVCESPDDFTAINECCGWEL